MADVLEFPAREAQAFAFLERELRALLESKGADEALVRFALDALTSVYTELAEASDYRFSVALPGNITEVEALRLQQQIGEGLEGVRRENHALLLKLAARLVLTELQLFQHRRS